MNDDSTLQLLSEMTASARTTTEKNKSLFYPLFSSYASDVENASKHVQNDNLRRCFFELYSYDETLERHVNRKFRKELRDTIKDDGAVSVPDELYELMLSAAGEVSVMVLGSEDGSETIEMPRLKNELEEHTQELGEEASTAIYLEMADVIRSVYKPFIIRQSEDMIENYNQIESACNSSWEEVFSVINEQRRNSDNEAIVWRNSDEK